MWGWVGAGGSQSSAISDPMNSILSLAVMPNSLTVFLLSCSAGAQWGALQVCVGLFQIAWKRLVVASAWGSRDSSARRARAMTRSWRRHLLAQTGGAAAG